jgi:hypothetical protein
VAFASNASPETGTWDIAIKCATGLVASAAKSFGNALGLTARGSGEQRLWDADTERLGSFHNQVELMQIDTIASPEKPGLLNLGVLPQAGDR